MFWLKKSWTWHPRKKVPAAASGSHGHYQQGDSPNKTIAWLGIWSSGHAPTHDDITWSRPFDVHSCNLIAYKTCCFLLKLFVPIPFCVCVFLGGAFFGNVFPPKGWQKNSQKEVPWLYSFSHANSMHPKNTRDAFKHVPDLFWKAPGPGNMV